MLRRPSQCNWLWLVFCTGRGLARKRQASTNPKRLFWFMMAVMLTKIALQAGSAENAAPAVRYQVRYWTTEDGLPQHEISCLKQTFDGYLWIGTRFGLLRFDGVLFTSFDESTTPEITNESIDALAEDMQQTLWIGTPAGLLSYRDHQFERVPITTQQDQGVRRLTSSHSGGLWLCTSH